MRRTTRLLEEIVGIARERGLTARDLAEKAGIAPPNLARIRRTGRYDSDTLERLLAAIDCDVRPAPRPRRGTRALPLVCAKLNAGRKERLGEDELRRLLTKFRRSVAAERAYSHLVGVIEEIPLEQVHDMVLQGDATLASLRRISDFVEGEGPVADWIDEQLAA